MSRDPTLPRHIGKYVLHEVLQESSTSVIYAGLDPGLERPVAVKLLRLSGEPVSDLADQYLEEARRCAQLNHPNIVTIYGAGEEDGDIYIVMQRARGKSLDELIAARDPKSPSRALGILRQTASALDHAHDVGLVHREIRPENILVRGEQNLVTLVGFGRSLLPDPSEGAAEGSTPVDGRTAYTSPEQIRGEKATAASDIYGLGVVALEMLAGEPAIDTEDRAANIGSAPSISQMRATLPPRVDAVIGRALAEDPTERWPSASAFVQALDLDSRTEAAGPAWLPRLSRTAWLSGGVALAIVGGVVVVAMSGTTELRFMQQGRSAMPSTVDADSLGTDIATSGSEVDRSLLRTPESAIAARTPATTDTPPADSSNIAPAIGSERTEALTDAPPTSAATPQATLASAPTVAPATPAPTEARQEPTDPPPDEDPPTDPPRPPDEPRDTEVPPPEPDPTDPPPPVPPTEIRPPRPEPPNPTVVLP